MADVSLKHIYKVYPNGTKAVNDFNMQIADKEFIVFVGPSGCGKSTTLRMIAGLEDISAGELKIGDLIVNDVEPKDRDIAMVFQNYALYPHMTVYENIAFGLRLRKLPKDEIHRRVVEAAEILGITEYLAKKPKEMSGGQRQRVALGRAIVREPKVMLLDEPLSNLDAKLRTQMRAEISKLHKKLQTTFIYVTHDQVEAMTMGTRIVVMKDGFIMQTDTPKNLYNYPANKFVAGFIGTPQMNFFEGTLKKEGENVEIDFAGSEAKITVPYSMLYKTRPAYLDGKTKVYIGLRAEDISLDSEAAAKSNAVVKVKVSHTEDLGNETLVYGDINMDGDGYSESATRIIVKDSGQREYRAGEIVEAVLNVDRVHLFDKETEESVLPRIPEYNYLDCRVEGGAIKFLGESIPLPPAIRCGEGEGELLIPTDAVTTDGEIEAEVVDYEEINGTTLLSASVGGKRIYAKVAEKTEGKTVKLGFDLKKITVLRDGLAVVEPMPETNEARGKFVRRKEITSAEENGRTKKRKVVEFGVTVNGARFGVSEEISRKIFAALGIKKAFTTQLRFEFSPYDVKPSDEGFDARVEEILDYGKEKFIKCSTADGIVYALADRNYEGEIKLAPDIEKTGIKDAEKDVRIV